MSWIIGISGMADMPAITKINSLIPSPLFHYSGENLFIKAGGNAKTCFCSGSSNGFIAAGTGIKELSGKLSFLSPGDYYQINTAEQVRKLNGHFAVIIWDKQNLIFFTDKTGLRDIYFTKLPGGAVLFSTRSDWIAKLADREINFKEFGGKWLLFNQLSSHSIFKGIERISGGKSAVLNRFDNSISIDGYDWIPSLESGGFSVEEFSARLKEAVLFPLKDVPVSLSLSGGMDSRVLLSYLLNSPAKNWDTHTFGNKNSTDSIVVNKIVLQTGIKHKQIDIPFYNINNFINRARNYAGHTLANNSLSGFLQLINYDGLPGSGEIIIDGGFGEIWRREFFNRLLVKGKKALAGKNSKEMLSYLITPRADIFNDDVKQEMLRGCEEQLENLLAVLPGPEETGYENWIDLFALKTRLLNYYSPEQSYLNEIAAAYMPFVQPLLLDNLFRLKVNERKNGKLFRQIIKKNYKPLSRFPLAKGAGMQPFGLNTLQSRVWDIINSRLRLKEYKDYNRVNLIKSLKPFILDTINSQSVKEYSPYDYNKISRLAAFIDVDKPGKDTAQIDWWLSFELFRQHLNKD